MKMTAAEAKKLGLTEQKPAKKPKAHKKINPELFKAMAKAHGLTEPVPEYRFKYGRKWAFDWMFVGYASPDDFTMTKVAVEIQGGLFTGGRHVRGAALLKEYEKINAAQIMGYKVILVTPQQVESGEAFELVKRALNGE